MVAPSSIKQRLRKSLLVLVVFSGLGNYAAIALAVTAPPAWKPPLTVISGGADIALQQGDRFFAYDNLGVPSLVYTDGNSITLSRFVPGLGWAEDNVALPLTGDANGASLAFDRRESPAISYGDSVGLHYVSFDPIGGTFGDTLVDDSLISNNDYTNTGTSIAFDRIGRPAIAAVDRFHGLTKFATDDNGDGTLSMLDTLETVNNFLDLRPTLAFDHLNHPVIGGNDGSFGDVFVKDPFIGWRGTTPAFGLGGGVDPTSVTNVSVAIDPDDGLPAVTWTDQSPGELHYAKWSPVSGAWVNELVDVASIGAELGNESLAFDPADGNPAISYSDEAGNLFFAYHDGNVWDTQLVLNTFTGAPLRTSLDFNEFGTGFPAIGYITSSGDVRMVVDPPAAVPEPGAVALLMFAVVIGLGRRAAMSAFCR